MSPIRPASRIALPFAFLAASLVAAAAAAAVATTGAGCGDSTSSQGQAIGTACTLSSQCGSDPKFFCDRAHPGGYCKKDCVTDGDCPAGSVCAHDGATAACHKKCDTVAECRAMYVCKPASTDPTTLVSHAICDVDDAAPEDGGLTGDGAATADGGATGDGGAPLDGQAGG